MRYTVALLQCGIETLSTFRAKYVLGLSATPFRRDGLDKALYIFIGPKIHTVSKANLHKTGAVLKPHIFRINTRFRVPSQDMAYASKLKALTDNTVRNKMIATLAKKDLKEFKSPILIVSDRVNHCKNIARELYEMGIDSRVLSGGECGRVRADQNRRW